MKLRYIIPLLLLVFLGPACAPKKIAVGTKPGKPVAEASAAEKRFTQAEKLFEDKAYAEAAAGYLEFAADFPGHSRAVEALMKAGSAYFAIGDYTGARKVYQQVASGYPEIPAAVAARVEIVLTYFYEGQFEELLLYAGTVLKAGVTVSQQMKLFAILGDSYMALDSPVDAAYAYARAYEIAQDQTGVELYERLKSALRLMERDQIDSLTERLENPELQQMVTELADALIYKRFTIGCLLPLSGRYEAYGRRALNGIQLALSKSAAARANPHIEIIIKDTRSDPVAAVRAVGELYESGAAAIIGPIVTAEPAARIAQERHLPIITFTQKENITAIGDFVFRNFFTPGMQVQAIVTHAVTNLGARRFAILYPDEKYGRTFMSLFWDEVIRQNGQVVAVESYDVKTNDFAKPVKKLVGLYYKIPADIQARAERIWPPFNKAREAGCVGLEKIPGLLYPLPAELACWKDAVAAEVPACVPEADPDTQEPAEPDAIVDFDAIFIPDAPNKVGLILPQLAFNDVSEITLMGTNLWSSETLIKMSREYSQGAILPDGFYADSQRLHTRQFVNAYQGAFDDRPGYIEAVGYDTARLVLQLISRPDVHSRIELRDELLRVADFKGATGATAFDYSGEVHKPLFLIQVKGGRFVEIGTEPDQPASPPDNPEED
ncbi:MAG: ABC transporter substrate-binding protein [Desulfobacterales bacterium]|nr:ABC transporter substrate-binding protein [Desulfobacterales bacterium]